MSTAAAIPASGGHPALRLSGVHVAYPGPSGPVEVVRGVDLELAPGEILGLVGESGSGKSTLAFAALRLLQGGARLTAGTVTVLGEDLYRMSPGALRRFRWERIAMVFQTAMNALNPVLTVGEQMADTLLAHRPGLGRRRALAEAVRLLELVRLDPSVLRRYPHELSGGMRQRAVIAIALALAPPVVLMDEPTTGLDVVVQRSILDEVAALQRRQGFAVLLISHDFEMVAGVAGRMGVMYGGRIVEVTPAGRLRETGRLHHPYTSGLLEAVPRLTDAAVSVVGIPGNPPDPADMPPGCAFHPRCPLAVPECRRRVPPLVPVGDSLIACHRIAPSSEEVAHA